MSINILNISSHKPRPATATKIFSIMVWAVKIVEFSCATL
jgi:hypothetical protein